MRSQRLGQTSFTPSPPARGYLTSKFSLARHGIVISTDQPAISTKLTLLLVARHEKTARWRIRPILLDFGLEHGPSFCYSRRPITGSPSSPRSPGAPPMTERQAEALDMVHFTAEEHALSMELQRGDIQLINNLATFHARDAFVDDLVPGGHQRHALRLWLRN